VSISQIAGYTYGTSVISPSPISQEEFRYLKQTVLFTEEDKQYLRMAGSILQKQTDVDLWYNFVGSPYLIQYSGKPKQPDSAYLGAVRQRFKQWILDTCNREYDQAWLDYQHEMVCAIT